VGLLNFEYYFDNLNFGYYTMMVCCFEHFNLVAFLTSYFRDTHNSMEEALLNYFASNIMMGSSVKMLDFDLSLDCKISSCGFS
jgi:hypothetical protein